MSPKRVSKLTNSLIVDIDNAIAGKTLPEEERHSAAVSAGITAVRLIGGLCQNIARIADALDDIAVEVTSTGGPTDAD